MSNVVINDAHLINIGNAIREKNGTEDRYKPKDMAEAIRNINAEEPETPQVHNYLMLYDGTLGEAGANGANVCSEVTGGWELNSFISSGYSAGTANLEDNRIYLETIYSGMKISTFTTINKVNIDDYKKICLISSGQFTSLNQNSWYSIFLGDVKSGNIGNQNEIIWLGTTQDGTTKASIADLSNTSGTDYYLQGYVSATGNSGSGKISIYGACLCKQDNYQQILDLAGITSIYTDETTICADETVMTTILNNEGSVKYMAYNCTGTFMLAFIQSETALTCLNKSPYKTLLYGNEVWLKFLSMVA